MSENDPKSDNTSGHGPTQEQPKTCSKLVWSNDLLDEGERVIVENSERSAESAASIVFAIREFSEAGEIPAASYAEEVDDMPSADIDDRKHIAAAKVGRTTVLLTRTLKHFPAEPLLEMSIRVLDADPTRRRRIGNTPNCRSVARCTLEVRLSRVLRKSDVRNRSELAVLIPAVGETHDFFHWGSPRHPDG